MICGGTCRGQLRLGRAGATIGVGDRKRRKQALVCILSCVQCASTPSNQFKPGTFAPARGRVVYVGTFRTGVSIIAFATIIVPLACRIPPETLGARRTWTGR